MMNSHASRFPSVNKSFILTSPEVLTEPRVSIITRLHSFLRLYRVNLLKKWRTNEELFERVSQL